MKTVGNNEQIKRAVEVLKNGGVVVFPTETSYGVGCNAMNADAVARVFALKGRPEGKGTPLIVDSLAMAETFGVFSTTAKKLAKKHWPGALTLVVPKKGKIAEVVLQDGTVALRVSSHPIARALAKGLGKPLVATSANRSGEPPAFSVHAAKALGADAFVSGGTLSKRKASTLAKVIGDEVVILRQGPVKL